MVGAIALLTSAWFVGRRYVENFVRRRMQPWAVFHLPANPTVLSGLEAQLVDNTVTLCNRSNSDWDGILAQIDNGYLASLDRLRAGECKAVPVHAFATESWKRMPPPRDIYVSRVAIVTHLPRNGYVVKPLKSEGQTPPTANE
jgi:hypothetical protein